MNQLALKLLISLLASLSIAQDSNEIYPDWSNCGPEEKVMKWDPCEESCYPGVCTKIPPEINRVKCYCKPEYCRNSEYRCVLKTSVPHRPPSGSCGDHEEWVQGNPCTNSCDYPAICCSTTPTFSPMDPQCYCIKSYCRDPATNKCIKRLPFDGPLPNCTV